MLAVSRTDLIMRVGNARSSQFAQQTSQELLEKLTPRRFGAKCQAVQSIFHGRHKFWGLGAKTRYGKRIEINQRYS